MATSNCPNCKKDSFTWYLDESISDKTIWNCNACSYQAFEDETLETDCSKCNLNTRLRLSDKELDYWWCCNCNSIEIVKK